MKRRITVSVLACLVAVVVYAADEIRLTPRLQVTKSGLQIDQGPGTKLIDMNGDDLSDNTQVFTPTATTQVSVASSVASNGILWVRNFYTNEASYVDFGTQVGGTFSAFMRVKGGEYLLTRLHPTNLIYGISNVSTQRCRIMIIED